MTFSDWPVSKQLSQPRMEVLSARCDEFRARARSRTRFSLRISIAHSLRSHPDRRKPSLRSFVAFYSRLRVSVGSSCSRPSWGPQSLSSLPSAQGAELASSFSDNQRSFPQSDQPFDACHQWRRQGLIFTTLDFPPYGRLDLSKDLNYPTRNVNDKRQMLNS